MRVLSAIAIGLLSLLSTANADPAPALTTTGTEKLTTESGLSVNYWQSDKFVGQSQRTIAADGSEFAFKWQQEIGGVDTAVSRRYRPDCDVDDLLDDVKLGFRIDPDVEVTEGHWWFGPKLIVRTDGNWGLVGNYENYVVEYANISPDEMDSFLKKAINRRGGDVFGEREQDSAAYKFYRVRHNEWDQFWAVRQTYRTSGTTSVKPIVKAWRDNGMPNEVLRTLRLNIETYGTMQGTIRLTNLTFPERLTARSE